MGVLEITGVAIAAFNKLMDKIPNYNQQIIVTGKQIGRAHV